MQCCSAPVKTGYVDNVFVFITFVYAYLPILLRLSSAVMATKSRHVTEVMATVQINVVAEEKKEADPFFVFLFFFLALDLYNAKHLKVYSEAAMLKN